jgi:hypothetical protein
MLNNNEVKYYKKSLILAFVRIEKNILKTKILYDLQNKSDIKIGLL